MTGRASTNREPITCMAAANTCVGTDTASHEHLPFYSLFHIDAPENKAAMHISLIKKEWTLYGYITTLHNGTENYSCEPSLSSVWPLKIVVVKSKAFQNSDHSVPPLDTNLLPVSRRMTQHNSSVEEQSVDIRRENLVKTLKLSH
ncbi:hypothetical protein E2C01_022903 [Portunus trituberculatus]|uniref:Uncharacterized protein n=1 Tax=Portunus trituberculatus TaxID=210409 RepID=A0A5B7E7E1_PORTR|nr:hypothetical protein [Portunus trituberculatus]